MRRRTQPGGGRPWRLEASPKKGAVASPVVGPPIATAVLAALRHARARMILPLAEIREARAEGERLANTMVVPENLKHLPPAFAAYALTQNLVSVLSETLTQLPEMAPFRKIIEPAEDNYMPQGPPMSTLTSSFFTSWAFFDARAGRAGETIGTTILAVADRVGLSEGNRALLRLMQDSRMGVFVHEGVAGEDRGHPLLNLRDLWTGLSCRAVCCSGYAGGPGELWYARVLPPPIPGRTPAVVFTTPYLLRRPGAPEWRACLRRALPEAPEGRTSGEYEEFMKYGPKPSYWNDFVFEAYASHRKEVIILEGLPDDPGSRPCSAANDWGAGR